MADPFNAEQYAEDQAVDLADLSYINQSAKRNLEVAPDLVNAIREAVTAVYGPDYRIEVMSGAQGKGSRGVVGSRRHTTGAAADVWVRAPDGKKLTGDDLVPLSQHWLATKAGSVGFPAKSGQSLHLDLVGGNGPGSVPRKKGEGALWYYGTPTTSQRDALGSSLTKGTTPKYAVSPEAVRKGLIPPADIPGVASLTDTGGPPIPAVMSASLRGAPSSVSAYAPSTAVPTVNDPFLAASISALSGKQQVPATSPAPVPAPAPSGMERLNIVDLTKGGKVRGVDIPANPYAGWQRGESTAPWVREAAALQPSTAPAGSVGGIVFHHTGSRDLYASMTAGQDPKAPARTGAQYYIDTDGTIYRYADDSDVMQNVSTQKFRTDAEGSQTRNLTNQSVIGIEVVASGSGKITEAQKKAAAALGSSLAGKYGIPPENVIGHGAIQGGVGGNKEADEGMELADLTRAAIASAPVRTASLDQGAPDLMEALSRRVAQRADMSSIPGSPFYDKSRPGNGSGGTVMSEADIPQIAYPGGGIGDNIGLHAGGVGSLTGDKPFPMVPDLLTALERRAAVRADPVGEGAKSTDLLTFLQKRAKTAPFRVANAEGSAGAGVEGSASGSAVMRPRVQIANAGGTAGFGVGGAASGAAAMPPRAYDSPQSAQQVAELYAGIFPARPETVGDNTFPVQSTFPARPSVIAPSTVAPKLGPARGGVAEANAPGGQIAPVPAPRIKRTAPPATGPVQIDFEPMNDRSGAALADSLGRSVVTPSGRIYGDSTLSGGIPAGTIRSTPDGYEHEWSQTGPGKWGWVAPQIGNNEPPITAPVVAPSPRISGTAKLGGGINLPSQGSGSATFQKPRIAASLGDSVGNTVAPVGGRVAFPTSPSTFPSRPAVVAPNTLTSTPRVGTIRTADGIAGTVQLPHDVRPSVTIPKLPMTATGSIGSGINNAVGGAAVMAPMTKTIMVANPDYAEYLKSTEIQTMPSGYIPGMETSAPAASKPNMRGGNRTPVMAKYATPPPKLIPKTITIAPVAPKPAQRVATVAPVAPVAAPVRNTGATVVDQFRAKGMNPSQAYAAAAASAHRPTNAAERSQARQAAAESEARALNNFSG